MKKGRPLPERRTYNLDEVAFILGVSRNFVYVAARKNELPVSVIKIGKRMLVSRAQLDRLFCDDEETP